MKTKFFLIMSAIIITFFLITFAQKDTTPPKVTILFPKDNSTVSGKITIQVQATDNIGVTRVEFFIDNTKIGELTKAPFNLSWDTTKVSNGKHTILVKAYDKAGNSASARITVNVNNKIAQPIVPTISPVKKLAIISPKNEERILGSTNIFVKILEGKELDKIEFYLDDKKIGEINKEPFEVNLNSKDYSNGYHQITVKSIYKGNVTANASVKVYIVNWKNVIGKDGWDEGVAVVQSQDGNFIIAGWSDSFKKDNTDIYLIKMGEWEKIYGGDNDDIAVSMAKTKDGDYIITGLTSSFNVAYYDVYVLKVDKNGNKIWEKAYGGKGYDRGNAIKETRDGGYIIAGLTESFGNGFEDVYLIKLNQKGDVMWHKAYGTPAYERAYDVIETSDDNLLVVGECQNTKNNSEDGYILKLNSKGEIIWIKNIGKNEDEKFYSVLETKQGEYLILGEKISNGKNEIYLLKVDKNGKIIWEKNYSYNLKDIAYSMCLSNDGKGILIAGICEVEKGMYDGFAMKIDENGKVIWNKKYGSDNLDIIKSICSFRKGYILVGSTQSYLAKDSNIFIVPIDEEGNILEW